MSAGRGRPDPAQPVGELVETGPDGAWPAGTRPEAAGTAPDVEVPRLVSGGADAGERTDEATLRPRSMSEFVGQPVVREQLGLVLEAARRRGVPPDHVLLAGPPGLGKTTLAMIVGAELSVPVRVTSGPVVQHAGDLAAILSSLEEGEVLFLDEIHRMARAAEEMLYVAMEDFRVDVVVGKGPGATAIPLPLPRFTLVGATTRAGMLPSPLRDRFGFTAHLDFYDEADLVRVLHRSATLLDARLADDAAAEIAGRSRGTPRVANRLLRRVRDWAEVHGTREATGPPPGAGQQPVQGPGRRGTVVDLAAARAALELFQVDELGLDRLDSAVLQAVCTRFGGGPVGLSTVAVVVGEEPETVETVCEPFLVRRGFLSRTPRGRVALPAAWEHLGLTPPAAGPLAPGQPGGQLPLGGFGEPRRLP